MNEICSYYPLTATPFKNDCTYKEIQPCSALRPFIRCFWGSEHPYSYISETDNIIIPDTCVDIIYNIDYTDNSVSGGFCGINDKSFYAGSSFACGHRVSVFGIRFYAWTAYCFAEDCLRGTKNAFLDIGQCFEWLDCELFHNIAYLMTLEDKAEFVQSLFLKKMGHIRHQNTVDTAVNIMLSRQGNIEISQLSKELYISRQLERNFSEYVGITPKKLCNLIRYQFLWRDILTQYDFDMKDAVYKYGYTDQSHLIKAFKKYHSMDIRTAKSLAMHHVGNIQYK